MRHQDPDVQQYGNRLAASAVRAPTCHFAVEKTAKSRADVCDGESLR